MKILFFLVICGNETLCDIRFCSLDSRLSASVVLCYIMFDRYLSKLLNLLSSKDSMGLMFFSSSPLASNLRNCASNLTNLFWVKD